MLGVWDGNNSSNHFISVEGRRRRRSPTKSPVKVGGLERFFVQGRKRPTIGYGRT